MRDQAVQRVGAEVPLGDPADRLDVTQSARAGLDVRLEVVGGIVKAMMAGDLLLDLGFEEFVLRPKPFRRQRMFHRREQLLGPGQAARLEERGRHTDVREALALAVIDRPHAVPDFEADVPQEGEKAFQAPLPGGRFALRQQDAHVDIGAGMKLAAPVAANRDQRQFVCPLARMQAPGAHQ